MKTQYTKILKSLLIGLVIFLIINTVDQYYFYDYHSIASSSLIRFYFYPMLLIADLINFLIPISETIIYKTLINPLCFDINNINFGHEVAKRISTLIIGIIWTSVLIYIYYSLNIFKKLPYVLRIFLYIIAVIFVIYISSIISVSVFGKTFARLCPGCP